jgi:MoaA/NifB/PqqE/SkfB family radical SAM enzyme
MPAANQDSRDFKDKPFQSLCYAPHTSMYFDTLGNVRVCCHNWSHPAGNISSQTIGEIWNGEAIRQIRRSLEAGSFRSGCGFCEWQLAAGSLVNLPMRKWDLLPVESKDPQRPVQMEFSLSNTCNLECIMCDGEASSAIRAHRENLPPIVSPYSDAFFTELRSYLPHLYRAKFLGGEPFLQSECFRIWGMLAEDGIALPCHVTTNGTQYNARMEWLLERIPFGISISVDGYRKETVESIRVHARYDDLMRNVNRFRDYCRARKTSFSLTYCLMRPNWEEFGDFCLFADSLDCVVWVNAVRNPPHLSLYTLTREELGRIAGSMERQSATLISRLGKNRTVWTGEVERLRARASGFSPIHD